MVKSAIPYFFVLASVLLSCEVEEPAILLDYPGDQIVLNGFVARERIEVFVGRAQDPNGVLSFTGGDTLHQAMVELMDAADSVWYQIPHVGQGNYVLDMASSLPVGKEFRLVANAAGFPEARSELIVIPDLQIDISATLTSVEEVDNEYRPETVYFNVTLADNSPSLDFFHVYATNRYRIPFNAYEPFLGNVEDQRSIVSLNTEESVDQQCGVIFFDASFILPDFCFANESFTFPLLVWLSAADVGWDSIGFTIAATSEFLYESSRNLDQSRDILDDLLFRPQLYRSNVEGGYGVVAPRHEQLVWVKR